MRIHYLQHVPFEGLGCIEEWAENQGHSLSATALYADEPLPPSEAFDFLIVMGGPMGVNDTDRFAWLNREKRFLEKVFAASKPVIGICLGAQLMADVLGARVYKNPQKEIGWHPVTRTTAARDSEWKAILPERFQAFHWHGDTFDLPDGALHLARSEACRHQAFFYPPAALGLQFHLESTRSSVEQLIHHCGDELTPAPYIQSAAQIQEEDKPIAPSNRLMYAILDFYQQRLLPSG